jgi:shikimate kinase
LLRVVLTGFMGAGKSTVGALLAAHFRWRFVDVDEHIAQGQARAVSELFRLHGEAHFRSLEAAAIAALLHQERVVIALGGGALEDASTRARLQAHPGTHLVFLETPLALALRRCGGGAGSTTRPLLQDRAALETRYQGRLPFYREAHQTVTTAGRSAARVAALLAQSLADRVDGATEN